MPLHWGHGASRVGTIWGPFAEILYFLVFKIDSQLLHHEGMLLVLDFGDSVSLSPQNLSHGCGSVQDVVQFIGNMGGFLSMWIFSQPYRTVLGIFICLCLSQLSGIMKFLFVCFLHTCHQYCCVSVIIRLESFYWNRVCFFTCSHKHLLHFDDEILTGLVFEIGYKGIFLCLGHQYWK